MRKTRISIGIALPPPAWLVKLPLGKLPGDIIADRSNFKVYVPITTMILISPALSLILWIFRK